MIKPKLSKKSKLYVLILIITENGDMSPVVIGCFNNLKMVWKIIKIKKKIYVDTPSTTYNFYINDYTINEVCMWGNHSFPEYTFYHRNPHKYSLMKTYSGNLNKYRIRKNIRKI